MDATAGRADFLSHRGTYLTQRQVPVVTDFTASRERNIVILPIIIMVIQFQLKSKSLKSVRTSRGEGLGQHNTQKLKCLSTQVRGEGVRGIPLSNVSTTVFYAQQIHIWVPHDGRGGDARREDHRDQGVILRKSVLAASVLTGITTLTSSGACSMV